MTLLLVDNNWGGKRGWGGGGGLGVRERWGEGKVGRGGEGK